MKYKELINNESGLVVRGGFVAIEGYLLTVTFSYLFGLVNLHVKETIRTSYRFWLVGGAANLVAIFSAFLIMHALISRWKASPSAKVIAASSIVAVSIALLLLSQYYVLHLYH
jgi:hypothetical protein